MNKESFYTDNFMTTEEIAKASKASKTTLHRKICPICGRMLVNIYYRSDNWKCKKCWDEDDSLNKEEK